MRLGISLHGYLPLGVRQQLVKVLQQRPDGAGPFPDALNGLCNWPRWTARRTHGMPIQDLASSCSLMEVSAQSSVRRMCHVALVDRTRLRRGLRRGNAGPLDFAMRSRPRPRGARTQWLLRRWSRGGGTRVVSFLHSRVTRLVDPEGTRRPIHANSLTTDRAISVQAVNEESDGSV